MSIDLFLHIKSTAEVVPNQVALLSESEKDVTYKYLLQNIIYIGNILNENKFKKVLMIRQNSIFSAELFLSCMVSGVDFCSISPESTPLEIKQVIEQIVPSLIVNENSIQICGDNGGEFDISHLFSHCEGNHDKSFLPSPGRLLVNSSGSEGHPKIIVIDSQRLFAAAKTFTDFYQLNKDDRFWNFLPMSYLGGLFNLLLIPIACGASVFIDRSFNGSQLVGFWKVVQEKKITILWLVPTILRLLINLQLPFGNLDISKIIRFALIGTAPLSYEEKNKFKDLFSINLYENYGLTETTFITCEPLKSSSSEDSQGVIFPGVQLNHELLRYEAEITVKSKYMFIGYLNRDGEIEQIDQEEYFRTGDIGVIKNNHLRLTGRVKDTIKKGGILINLGWIDRILRKELEFEFVSVQINHPILGEDYELLIVSEFSVQAHEIIWNVISKYLRKEIQPNSIKFVSKLDYTKSGKILRRFPLNNEVRDNHDLKFGK